MGCLGGVAACERSRNVNVSICMATFNGARYLKPQMDSILAQMEAGDELIVVDDASQDGTLDLVRAYGDPRIRVQANSVNVGHVGSFSKALTLARHPVMVLADQDDIWVEGRLAILRDALTRPGIWLATGNSRFIDAHGVPIGPVHPALDPAESARNRRNILRIFTGKAFYYGCNMAFNRDLAQLALPVPAYVESHDLWLAMAANLAGANLHIGNVLLCRRIHGDNVTDSKRPLWKKLKSRLVFVLSLLQLALRCRKIKSGRRQRARR
jgi:glycosyltransferase involved in cell wall biosynthesis